MSSHEDEIHQLRNELKAALSLAAARGRIIHKLEKDLEETKQCLQNSEERQSAIQEEVTLLSTNNRELIIKLTEEGTNRHTAECQCLQLQRRVAALEPFQPKFNNISIREAMDVVFR
jgi:hypothetical protein